ncbi:MAG TPA: hypothetical protein VH502_04305 [Actinoplanes sp.]
MTAAGVTRRSLLILAAASLTAASAGPYTDVPPIMRPLPVQPPVRRGIVRIRPLNYWAGVYQQSWDYQAENIQPQSRSQDSWDHYSLSYSVDANIAMFRATGERRYLDRALEWVENVMAASAVSATLRSSQYHDRYRGWVSQQESGTEVPLYESYFWRYATALLPAMRQAPAVYADARYRARYDRVLTFAEANVFEKWFTRGADDNIYRSRTHMAAHWAQIALNLSVVTTDAARRDRYHQVVDNIDLHLPNVDSGLRRQLRRNPAEPTAYFWSDVWGSSRRPGQDVGHGNGVLAYVVEAHDNGGRWTDADVAAFSSLLTKVVWPGGRTYRGFVDGTGTDNGWYSDGFVKLGRYDAAVQRRLDEHQVVNDQFAANMALNAKLLS